MSEVINTVAVLQEPVGVDPLMDLSTNVQRQPDSSPIAMVKRSFSDLNDGDSVDTKDIITPPNSTIRNSKSDKNKSHRQPLSPEMSSPITHSKTKKQKNESSTRSNGNLTLDELIETFATRKSRGELNKKPPYSYATLISLAILQSDDGKLTLSQIYNWISLHFPYYKQKDAGWQNSIRHNLSLNEAFVKTEKSGDGKGHFWEVQVGYESRFFKNETRSLENIRETLKSIEHFFEPGTEVYNDSEVPEDYKNGEQEHYYAFNNGYAPFDIDGEQIQPKPQEIRGNNVTTTPDYPVCLSPSVAIHSNSTFSANKFSPGGSLENNSDGNLAIPQGHLKRFHTTLGLPRVYDKNNLLFENSGNPFNPISSANLLKSPQNFKRYTSSFNSSFEETSPLPTKEHNRNFFEAQEDNESINEEELGSSTLLTASQSIVTDLLKTPKVKISDNLDKTPVRFITTPRDDSAILRKWQTPSNLFEDFYCSPLFKGMGTPVKFTNNANNNTSKILSPDGTLTMPHLMRESDRSKLSASGLFGVDVYSVWKRATENAQTNPSDAHSDEYSK
ncbi:hypothetical protein Kpol_1028p47 [Vanderwaltozyma polyspora DSM 70294]|uniref:Fork-head domain-containing protein n=1 Tax=Vanderwaltozyma polyspora (strain ATCC 22028 / DSM 70294 / BCRC 21397 / CBS 2163 / NBRC 10782 / NRRL Y-8283 / UCD 57-17) TaxID=436907 RepID=A7TG15_VANPO|nr:uncharacterized protein Kpol_1028p47 [Vanderwaltozyma polyspora DSM 70294]EDO18772.1 hypothetical protein Kpol_1028p47 [Vanderwaltozyma polyspora DSM 70294]